MSLLALCLGGVTDLAAQGSTGAFLGTVTDETGGVLPGATVTITNLSTSLQRVVITGQAGHYVAPLLPPGPYEIAVELAGFKRAVRERLTLRVAQEQRADQLGIRFIF